MTAPDHPRARQFAEKIVAILGDDDNDLCGLARCYLEALGAIGKALDEMESARPGQSAPGEATLRNIIEKVGGR